VPLLDLAQPDTGWQTWLCSHVWVGSKAGWDEISDAGKQHTKGFRA
jgi:hypothetical protein